MLEFKLGCYRPPPPITRPGGQYESEDEQVLKGPKVA